MGKTGIILLCFLLGLNDQINIDESAMSCDIIVNAGEDLVLCNGENAQLDAVIQGEYADFEWIPSIGLNDPTLLNPVVDVPVTTEYVLKATSEGDNMVINGHFETGNILPSTTTFYYRDPKDFPNGVIEHYTVGNSSDIVLIPGCDGHTGPKMMVTNGPGKDVWCQSVNVKPNTDYKLELWVGGVKIFIVANSSAVDVKINGIKLGSVKGSKYCDWNLFEKTWNSGPNINAKICLDTDGGKRDYAIIDDITFVECCVTTDTVTVEVEEINAIIEDPDILTCINHPLILNATNSSQGVGFNYKWSTKNGLIISGGNTLSPIIDAPGIYTLIVTSMNGCEDSTNVEIISETDPPFIELNSRDLDCANPSVIIFVDTVFKDQLLFEWSGPNGFSSIEANPSVIDSGWYEVVAIDEGGCKTTKRIYIGLDNDVPNVSWDYDTLTCLKTSVDFSAIGVSAQYNYQWNGPLGFNSTKQNISASIAGIYEVIVTGLNGCELYIKMKLEENVEKPSILLMNDTLDCVTETASLEFITNSLNYNVNWSGPNGFQSQDNMLVVVEPGKYTVSITDLDNGCKNEESATIYTFQPIESIHTVSSSRCDMDSILLIIDEVIGGTPPYLYSINGQALQSNTDFLTPPGSVDILIEDANSCTYSERLDLNLLEDLEGDLIEEISLQRGQRFSMPTTINRQLNEIFSIEWSPKTGLSCSDCLNPVFTATENQVYTVIIRDVFGCEISKEIRIQILASNSIFIPNIITPNGDGINDIFAFYSPLGVVATIENFEIYSNWGEIVFNLLKGETNDPNSGWDGRFYNKRMLPGVYVYKALLIWPNGVKQDVRGSVTLIR